MKSTSRFVLSSTDARGVSVDIVGGKAAGLARLGSIEGLTVPDWYCLTVDAYRAFASAADLESIACGVSVFSEVDLRRLSDYLRETPIPRQVHAELCETAEMLLAEGTALAVRSSSPHEDLQGASFAGQYKSFLDLRQIPDVVTAVKECWLSMFTVQALQYRLADGRESIPFGMAVVLQLMVRPSIAGVVFTQNPVLYSNDELLVNVVRGSGDRLVSGEITPEQWRIRKDGGEVIDHTAAPSEAAAILDDEQRWKLFAISERVERELGPSDLEFAFEGATLFVLQARPITAFASRRTKLEFGGPPGSWTRKGFGEWFQTALTPLTISLLIPQMSDATDVLLRERLCLQRPVPSWTIIEGYYYVSTKVTLHLGLIRFPARFLRDLGVADSLWTHSLVPRHMAAVAEARAFALEQAIPKQLIDFLQHMSRVSGVAWAWIVHSALFAKFSESLFRRVFELVGPAWNPVHLLAGFQNKSVEADQGLWDLAEDAKRLPDVLRALAAEDPVLALRDLCSDVGLEWVQRVDAWVSEYGHRLYDLDLIHPTLQDDRALVLFLIHEFIDSSVDSPAQRLQRSAAVRQDRERDFEEWGRRRRVRRWMLRLMLRTAQRYAAIRESRPFYLHLAWPIMRRAALRIGEEFCKAGILRDPSDVFFLSMEQIESIAIGGSPEPTGKQHLGVEKARALWRSRCHSSPPKNVHPP